MRWSKKLMARRKVIHEDINIGSLDEQVEINKIKMILVKPYLALAIISWLSFLK